VLVFCIDITLGFIRCGVWLYDTRKSWAVFYLLAFLKSEIDRMLVENGECRIIFKASFLPKESPFFKGTNIVP